MSRSLKQWKEAASLIIAAAKKPQVGTVGPATQVVTNQNESSDYQLLLLKRQRKTAFASAHVFPGGVIDPSDFSKKWLDIFKFVGATSSSNLGLPDLEDKSRPWPVTVKRDQEWLPNDVAFRICALRETFEESGILLLTKEGGDKSAMASSYHGDMSAEDVGEWQKRVHSDGTSFIDLCHELKAVPNIWSLHEWFHILTPQFMKKRYDTMFYLCAMDRIPTVNIDDVEMVHTEWSSPSGILRRFGNKEITLEPPQLIQAASLLKFPVLQQLHEYARERQLLGSSDWMPVLFVAKDGVMINLPGDDLYPSDVTYETNQSPRRLDETLEEAKLRSSNLFRTHIQDQRPNTLLCNVKLPHGVPSPLSGKDSEWQALSN